MEAVIAVDPAESRLLRLTIKSLEKKKRKLETEWLNAADQSRG